MFDLVSRKAKATLKSCSHINAFQVHTMTRLTTSVFRALLWRLLGALSGFGLSRLGPFRLLSATTLNSAAFPREAIFLPESPATRAANVVSDPTPPQDTYPALGYRRLVSALVTSNRRCSSVISGNHFVLPESVDPGPWNIRVGEPTIGGVLRQSDNRLLVNSRRLSSRIPRGIFVGTWSPQNWYHWTIDTLPSVYFAQYLPSQYDNYPLLLPETGVLRERWLEPLDLVRGNREVITLSDNRYSKVEDLVWIDSPSSPGPLPLRSSGRPHFRVHAPALNAYRDHMLAKLGLDEGTIKPHKKIFLARNQSGNRPYNQEELLAIAEGFGFATVYLEHLSFRESVTLMLESEYIIGPHGAGWASALDCQSSAHGLMWTWPESKLDNWFTNIAHVRQFPMLVSYAARENSHGLEMPLVEFEQRLAWLLKI